jgi:hypothetical protein
MECCVTVQIKSYCMHTRTLGHKPLSSQTHAKMSHNSSRHHCAGHTAGIDTACEPMHTAAGVAPKP